MTAAILYSGGLDSLIMLAKARHEGVHYKTIWVNVGQPYAEPEWEAVQRTAPNTVCIDAKVMDAAGYCGMVHHVIPGRNMLLATIAASFGDEVWVGALLTERHPFGNRDKSSEWQHLMSGMLTYNFLPVRPWTTVEFPLGRWTKRESIRHGIEMGLSVEDFAMTISCHNGEEPACGECIACFHRWAAMSLNGIHEDFQVDPWTTETADEQHRLLREAEANRDHLHYHEARVGDIREAFALVGVEW